MIFWVVQFVPTLHKSATALSESSTCVQMFHRDVQSQQHLSDIVKQLAGQDIFTDQFQMMGMTKKVMIKPSAWSLSPHSIHQC